MKEIDKHPISREALEEMKTVKVTPSHTRQSLERALALIQSEPEYLEPRHIQFKNRIAPYWGSVSLLLILAVGAGVANLGNKSGIDTSVSRVMTEYTTRSGDKATILLPDGSRVFLNVGSHLRLSPDFLSGERTVELEGGAVFEVMHHQRSPFVVNTARTSSKVLGTEFLVEDYKADQAAVIAVRSGRVDVNGIVLPPHQEIAVKDGSDIRTIRPYFAGRFDFINGTLNFPAMSVAEAVPILERWYDIKIRVVDNGLLDSTVAGEFTNNIESLGEILAMLLKCKVKYETDVLILGSDLT